MALIRPRLTDYHGVLRVQKELDFAIPFLDEDIPLHVDPFLLWKSPSQQDQALHTSLVNSFNYLSHLVHSSRESEACDILVYASECDEVGLGHSKSRRGVRMSRQKANEILKLFRLPQYERNGFTHFEEAQLYINQFARDRVSDISCSYLKSFLVDYTMQECSELGIPLQSVSTLVYDYRRHQFVEASNARLPTNPETGRPIILVPKRWLRYNMWISFDEYFRSYCPLDEVFNPNEPHEPAKVLTFNRENYGSVRNYIEAKERSREDCVNDPLFSQLPITSVKRKFATIKKLPTGKDGNADRKYEDATVQLMATLLYPHLDFAQDQSRTDSGVLIRDLIFYNNDATDFLREIREDYASRQLVFELKNVATVGREHINQLNRYLSSEFGGFGVLVTRNPLKRAMFKNTVDLWSGQRRCIITLTDQDLALMVDVFESKQRNPIDVLKKKYVEFRRACPG